jgi:hypothetical protein
MNNFISVSLTGGLGDHINQYIFGRILSEKLNCELILDTSYYKKKLEYFIYDYWHYPLSKSNIQFKKNCYYFGYWHSLPFFKKKLQKIKKEFSLKKESKNLKKIKKKK